MGGEGGSAVLSGMHDPNTAIALCCLGDCSAVISQYVIETGVDYPGNDIAHHNFVPSPLHCAQL